MDRKLNPYLPRVKHTACGKNTVYILSDTLRCLYCNTVIHQRDEITVDPLPELVPEKK